MKTEIFLYSTVSLSGCEPCHYVQLAAVFKFPPHLGLTDLAEIAGFQGGKRIITVLDFLSTSHGQYNPGIPAMPVLPTTGH